MEEPRKALALVRIEKAEHCIESANVMIDSGFYLDAANRSYYAIFHAMRSVLALEAKDFSKHAGVISYFRKNYIKTGIFSIKHSRIIDDLFEVRSNSDYDDFFVIEKSEVLRQVEDAKFFVSSVKEYVEGQQVD
jgi:uncharacterized protein (UPF0332 family)